MCLNILEHFVRVELFPALKSVYAPIRCEMTFISIALFKKLSYSALDTFEECTKLTVIIKFRPDIYGVGDKL